MQRKSWERETKGMTAAEMLEIREKTLAAGIRDMELALAHDRPFCVLTITPNGDQVGLVVGGARPEVRLLFAEALVCYEGPGE